MNHPPLPPGCFLPIRTDCIDGWMHEINRLKAFNVGLLPFNQRGWDVMEYHAEALAHAHNCLWDWVDLSEEQA